MTNNQKKSNKLTMYIDMDNVLVNFRSGIEKLKLRDSSLELEEWDSHPEIFSLMDPMQNAVESFNWLCKYFEVFILSTAPFENPAAWGQKLEWVKKHLGKNAYKRLILTHRKDLNIGDYLIDDRLVNGASEFSGKLLLFGSENYPDWDAIVSFFKKTAI